MAEDSSDKRRELTEAEVHAKMKSLSARDSHNPSLSLFFLFECSKWGIIIFVVLILLSFFISLLLDGFHYLKFLLS